MTKMDKATLRALKGSIRKWEKIVAGTGQDNGPLNCPLCKIFRPEGFFISSDCGGCPVKQHTGQSYCSGTPYVEWFDEVEVGSDKWKATTPKLKHLAEAELKFLKSLLPHAERAK